MPILTVKSRYLPLMQSGQKTTTIRLSCKVRPGDSLTFTDYRASVRTRCTSVAHVAIRDLTEGDAHADGFTTRADLLNALHAHYTLAPDARVWIIRFALNDSPHSLFASP